MSQFWSIILGAVLALGSSIVLEFVRVRVAERRQKYLFKAVLSIEIPVLARTIERLIEDKGKLGYFPLVLLSQLQGERQGYDRNRDWVVMFKDDAFRQSLIDFYSRLSMVQQEINSLEGLLANASSLLAAQPALKGAGDTKRNELVVVLQGLASKSYSILERLKAQ